MPKSIRERRLTRGMLERLHYIDGALRRKEPVTCSAVAKHFEVERKTIQRDIDYLCERLNRPVQFDPRRNSYYYTKQPEPLPDMILTEGELFGVMIARNALEQYRGTPYFQQLSDSYHKLASSLDTEVSFSVDDYAARVSFKGMGTPKIDPGVFEVVSRSVARRVMVTFDYHKAGERAARRRTVQLWHITHRGHMWYVVGFDPSINARRTFALTRIKNPLLTRRKFVVPEDFSPEKHFANAFSVMCGEGDYRVVIRFRGASAARVQECEWHASERWRQVGDGGEVELELRLAALEEIERWVLPWGPEAEVIEPKELRDHVAATVAALVASYRSEGTLISANRR